MTMKLSAMQKRLRLKEKTPVSVAKPGSKRLRGHEEETNALAMSAKKYKVAKVQEAEKKKGACGGVGVDVDVLPNPTDSQSTAAMDALRKQWLEKTLPRTKDEGIVNTKVAEIRDKMQAHHKLLMGALGRPPRVTGKKARYGRMGVKGQKWELFIWGAKEADAIGLGYGTFSEALFIALDSAIAGLMQRVADKDGLAPAAADEEDVEDEEGGSEEDEEAEEGEELEEEDSDGDGDDDDDDDTLADEE